jgi:hypothetical protein
MPTLAKEQGITVQALIRALYDLPPDAVALVLAADGSLQLVADAYAAMYPRQVDRESEITTLEAGRYAELVTVNMSGLVEDELGEAAAELAEGW